MSEVAPVRSPFWIPRCLLEWFLAVKLVCQKQRVNARVCTSILMRVLPVLSTAYSDECVRVPNDPGRFRNLDPHRVGYSMAARGHCRMSLRRDRAERDHNQTQS